MKKTVYLLLIISSLAFGTCANARHIVSQYGFRYGKVNIGTETSVAVFKIGRRNATKLKVCKVNPKSPTKCLKAVYTSKPFNPKDLMKVKSAICGTATGVFVASLFVQAAMAGPKMMRGKWTEKNQLVDNLKNKTKKRTKRKLLKGLAKILRANRGKKVKTSIYAKGAIGVGGGVASLTINQITYLLISSVYNFNLIQSTAHECNKKLDFRSYIKYDSRGAEYIISLIPNIGIVKTLEKSMGNKPNLWTTTFP